MKKSRTVTHPVVVESPRHLPMVDLLVDARTELFELAVRSGLKVMETMLEEESSLVKLATRSSGTRYPWPCNSVRSSCAASRSVASVGYAMKTACLVLRISSRWMPSWFAILFITRVKRGSPESSSSMSPLSRRSRNSTNLIPGNGICCPARSGTLTA